MLYWHVPEENIFFVLTICHSIQILENEIRNNEKNIKKIVLDEITGT